MHLIFIGVVGSHNNWKIPTLFNTKLPIPISFFNINNLLENNSKNTSDFHTIHHDFFQKKNLYSYINPRSINKYTQHDLFYVCIALVYIHTITILSEHLILIINLYV